MQMFLNKQMFNFLEALMKDIIDSKPYGYLEIELRPELVADAEGILNVLRLIQYGKDN